MTRSWLARGALLLLLGCPGGVVPVTVPPSVVSAGGLFVPWSAEAEAHWQDVLTCASISPNRPRPTLWIAVGRMVSPDGELAGAYVAATHTVLVSGAVLAEYPEQPNLFWFIVRHEFIHAASGEKGHEAHFDKAAVCGFAP